MPRKPLSPKQQQFVKEYLLDLNATAAAARAGYKHPNKQGPALLVNLGISTAIAEEMAKRAERIQVTQDDVVKGLRHEALGKGPDTNASARVTAWTNLGKHLGMFVDRLRAELIGKDGGPVQIGIVEVVRDADQGPPGSDK